MLQQTRVEAVIPYFERFLCAFPTVHDLAKAEEQQYLKLWEGLGYYSRVRNLHRAAHLICEENGGAFPQTYADLIKLPGIGEYTAGAIASIAFGEAVPAVDGNVLRVAARLTADTRVVSAPSVKKEIRAQLQAIMPKDPGSFNQALMELGAVICIPNGEPRCGECPVQHLCNGAYSGIAAQLPKKAPRKERKRANRTVFLICSADKVALRRRDDTGLLAGMWELPGVEGHLSPAQAKATLRGWGFDVKRLLSLRAAKHVFTHVEWHMVGYYAEVSAALPEAAFAMATSKQRREQYALPSAFHSFIKVLEGNL